MLNSHEASGTALGPYTSADIAKAHIANLAAEADKARLVHAAQLAPKRTDTASTQPRHRHHWHAHHWHLPASHPT